MLLVSYAHGFETQEAGGPCLWLRRKSVVEVDCLLQISRDRLVRCYHFISLRALAIYFVIWYTEQSELPLVVLDVECDMDNRDETRTLYPHRRPTVSDFHVLFLFFC